MSIPLEPRTPVEGVASPAPTRQQRPYVPRALGPRRLRALVLGVAMLTKRAPVLVGRQIAPQVYEVRKNARGIKYVTGRKVGFTGSGLFFGADNVAKSVTYRATYVPGGFNGPRDARRLERAQARLQESVSAGG